MARKSNRKVILVALEVTAGVDAIDGATGIPVRTSELKIEPMQGEALDRNLDDGNLGNSPELLVGHKVQLTFKTEVVGSGTAGTAVADAALFEACGRTVAVTAGTKVDMTVADNAEKTLTIHYWEDGVLHAVVGARGNLKLTMNAAQIGHFEWTFTGKFVLPTANANPAIDWAAYPQPLPVGSENSAFTLNGQALKLIEFSYDQGNNVIHQEYVGADDILITDRKPTMTVVVEAPTLGTFDPFALAKAHTLVPVELTHGPAGNRVTHTCAQVQLGRPTYSDKDGGLTYSIPLRPIANDTIRTH